MGAWMRRQWYSLSAPNAGALDYKWYSPSSTLNTGNLDYKWAQSLAVYALAPKWAKVYGAFKLGHLRLYNRIYGQDNWVRWLWHTKYRHLCQKG